MASFYPYLVSSLPALQFGMKPPLTFEGFIAACDGLVPEADMALLRALPSGSAPEPGSDTEAVRRWREFDTMLRNELVMIRAARRKTDGARYLRPDGEPASSYEAHIAINAYRRVSPLEGEREFDFQRWRRLDELAFGHYFDIDALVVYGYKLMILEKWDRIASADGARLVAEALAGVPAGTGSRPGE